MKFLALLNHPKLLLCRNDPETSLKLVWQSRQQTLRGYCPNVYTFLPGCLSCTVLDKPIIGPNFTHLNEGENVLNIFLGSVNVSDVMNRYRSSKYKKSYSATHLLTTFFRSI